MWWVSHNAHGAFTARGIHGQAIYIDPAAEMVIARFASHPLGRQRELRRDVAAGVRRRRRVAAGNAALKARRGSSERRRAGASASRRFATAYTRGALT